jgi:hypothetical protein
MGVDEIFLGQETKFVTVVSKARRIAATKNEFVVFQKAA